MLEILRFWLDREVDGFRADMIYHLAKHPELIDNPPNPALREGDHPNTRLLQTHSTGQPDIHDVVAEMRRVLDAYDHRVLIGEAYLPSERLMALRCRRRRAPAVQLPAHRRGMGGAVHQS